MTRGAAAGADKDTYAAAFLRPEARGETFHGKNKVTELKAALQGIKGFNSVKTDTRAKDIITKYAAKNEYTLKAGSLEKTAAEDLEDTLLSGVVGTIKAGSRKISSTLGIQGGVNTAKALKSANIDQTMGNIFESVLNFAGAPFDKSDSDAPNAPFDYGKGLQRAAKPFGLPMDAKADAKTFFTEANLQSFIKKVNNENIKEAEKELRPIITQLAAEKQAAGTSPLLKSMEARNILGLDQKANEDDIKAAAKRYGYTATMSKSGNTKLYGLKPMAMGGKIDSVPALLTPGEFVVKKSAAQSIGYGNLNKMNQTGVQRFNTGGVVQRFETGGSVTKQNTFKSGDFGLSSAKDVALVNVAARQNATAFNKLTAQIESFAPEQARAALVYFARNIQGVGDEAVVLDKSIEAAHRSATQFGAGSPTRGDKKVSAASPVFGPGFAPGMSGGESRGPRAKLTGDKQAQLERISLRAAKKIEAMGISGKAAEQALVVYRGALKRGDKHHAAMNTALKAAEAETRKTGGTLKRFRTKMSQVAQAAGNNLLGPKGQRGAQMAAGAQRGGEIAGQAQQFAFMASMIGSTAIQMSSLSNATKQAASETLGMATAMIGVVGTLAQMVTGIIANIAATKASTAAHGQEAASVGKASLGKLGGAFAGAAAGAAAVAAGFYYYSAKARAQADELAASTDEAIKKIKEGGGGSAEDIKANVREEVALRGKSGALKGAAVTAGVSGVAVGTATAAGFAAAGAAAGSVVPVLGTVVGAGVGLAAGFIYYAYAAEEAAAAAEKEADALDKSVDRLVSLYQSAHQLDQALKDIDLEKDLTPEQRVKRRVSALTDAGGAESSAQIASAALKELSQMATKAGVSIGQLDENTFKDLPNTAKRLKINQQALADSTEDVTKRLNAARATLVEARGNITGDEGSAKQAMEDPNSALGQALKAVHEGIDEETKIKVEAAKAQAADLQNRADKAKKEANRQFAGRSMSMGTGHAGTTGPVANPQKAKLLKEAEKLEKQAQEQQNKAQKAIERGEQQKKSETKVTDDAILAKKREKEQLEASIQAQEALRQATLKTEETMNRFVDQRRSLKQMEQALHNTVAAASGTAMSFDRMAPEGLGDLSRVGDQAAFARDVDNITAGESDEVKRMGQVAKDTARLLAESKGKRVGGFAIEKKMGVEGAGGVLRDMLPDLEGVVGEDIFKGMAAELSKAAEDGVVSEEEWDRVFAPMIEKGKESAEGLQQLVDINNKMISFYQKQTTALHKIFNDEIAVRQKLVDTQAKGAELRAQARGGSVSSGMKEASRQRRAQLGLIQRKPSGMAGLFKKDEAVATAGDVGSVSKAKDAAQKRLKQMAQEQRTETFTQEEMVARGKEEARLRDTVKKTTAELARLADQSDRAADIMGEIDKERAKREQATSVITDFVVGGADKRRGMAGAAAGVGAAVRTGTLQNQTEEQRSATVGMLDQLSDVIIAGTGGLTGKQVKQELVFQDAVKMGLDPAVAKQLALGTSKEEQLINALDRLTHQMEQAAMAQVAGGFAQGGVVYASRGASIFKPRGTDTVPAMLTPGEFVVRKSAVDKIGANNLEALNRSKGGVVYRQGGGGIGAGNAQFVGQSKKVSIMGGDAYRGLFSDSLKTIGIKKFGA